MVGYSGVVAEFLEAATKDNSVGVLIHVGIVLHANHGLHVEEYQSRGFPVDPFLGATGVMRTVSRPFVLSMYEALGFDTGKRESFAMSGGAPVFIFVVAMALLLVM